MSVYAYRALDIRRTAVQGIITADSPRHARDMLRGRGFVVQDMQAEQGDAMDSTGRRLFRRRGLSSQVASAVGELATLLSVGVVVVDAVEILTRQYRGRFRTSLVLLKDQVASGVSLADAMSRQPDVFDELTIRMVEVGENSGNLETVLDQLGQFQERFHQLKDRVTSALLYPAIVFLTSIGVTLFSMTVVVPMLLTTLVQSGRPLPWPTRILKATSDLLVHQGAWLLTGFVALAILCLLVLRTTKGRRLWHSVLLRLPVVGSMAQRQAISRIAMVIATLMRSGIVYLRAVEIAAGVSRNLVFREALLDSSRAINAGQDIGVALERTGVFPPMVIHVFSVGQASGRLEEMLDKLAVRYDRQVATLSSRLASILEPVLILLLAVFVGFILFATLLPILEAGNVL